MILTVGNTKGGVGKSTIALQLALARVDGDRQGTSQTAVAMRAEAAREPGLSCALPFGLRSSAKPGNSTT